MQNLKKKTDKNPLNTISIVYFLKDRLFTEVFSRTTTIHPVFFADGHYGLIMSLRGRTLSRHVINLNQ